MTYLLLALWLWQAPAQPPAGEGGEERDLEMAVAEAGSSPVEYARALERHLKKYPKSKQREEIERVIVQAAMDLRDKRRLIEYGVAVLERGLLDPQMLDHVTRALLDREDKESNERALKFSQRLEKLLADEQQRQEKGGGRAPRVEDIRFRLSRAQVFQARALGTLGKVPEAAEAARRAYTTFPQAEPARELARWLEKSGEAEASLPYYAEAFALAEPALQGRDRDKLGEAYRKVKGSEAGLGDLMLAAWDRARKRQAEERDRLRALDPNYGAAQPADFTLTGMKGDKLHLGALKGKVAVLDFWATWCGPCRAQYPLYQQVKQRFRNNPDVVFLAVNTDDDRGVVAPFLQAQKWEKNVYYDDGLGALLKVNSIPTTMILGRSGALVSRMNGYIADRFVDMLSERIEEALAEKP
jgi:thiol-disulfide isomerase/thioredoxin